MQLNLYPKPGGKVTLVVQHTGLPTSQSVETRRKEWKSVTAAIARQLSA